MTYVLCIEHTQDFHMTSTQNLKWTDKRHLYCVQDVIWTPYYVVFWWLWRRVFLKFSNFYNEWLVYQQINQAHGEERWLLGVSCLPPNAPFLQNCFFHILMNFYTTSWCVELLLFHDDWSCPNVSDFLLTNTQWVLLCSTKPYLNSRIAWFIKHHVIEVH